MRTKAGFILLLMALLSALAIGCTQSDSGEISYPLSQDSLEQCLSNLPVRYTIGNDWLESNLGAQLQEPGYFAISASRGIYSYIKTLKFDQGDALYIEYFAPSKPYATQVDFFTGGTQPLFDLAQALYPEGDISGAIQEKIIELCNNSSKDLLAANYSTNINLRQGWENQVYTFTTGHASNLNDQGAAYYLTFSIMSRTVCEEEARERAQAAYESYNGLPQQEAGPPEKTVAEALAFWATESEQSYPFIIRGALTEVTEHQDERYDGQIYYTGQLTDATGSIAVRVTPTYLNQQELAEERDHITYFDTAAEEPLLLINNSLSI